MAKASNKKNKLTIDLGNLELTGQQSQKLLDALYKTVGSKLQTAKKKAVNDVQSPEPPVKAGATVAAAKAATITATFRNVDPGLSELTVTYKGESKTITQSGTISFADVKRGEVLMIQGKSLGKADISIDRQANPQNKSFEPGIILFNFFIL